MANNRLVVQSGGTAGAILGTVDVFGTNLGAETVTVYDNTIANFQGDFARGGDTIRLTDVASDFTVQISGSNAVLTSASDGITVVIPIGTVGVTIVFENSAGNLVDSRTLVYNGTNVVLGSQVVTNAPVAVAPDGNNNSQNNIVLTAGVDTTPGGVADDTYIGFNRTLNAGDKLDGGAGYNTLSLSTDTALTGFLEGPYTYGGFTTVNVQRIEVTNDDDQAILIDLSGTKGVETLVSLNSSDDITFLQATSLNANGADIELNNVTNGAPGNTAPDVNVQYQDSVVAGDTVVDVVIKTSFADNLKIGSVSNGNSGIETVNISNELGASELDTLDTNLTTLNIKATQNLKIDDALNTTVRTIDASASTATVDIDFSDNDGANQDVTYIGSSGIDIVEAGNADDSISTGTGDDTVNAANGDNFVDAGEGANSVTSGNGADTIRAGAGNDTISSGAGNDDINAGDGDNSVAAGSGNDVVVTGAGADTINAGSGDDLVDSGAGNDSIFTGSGFDTVIAGEGDDTVTVAAGEFNANGEDFVRDNFSFGDGTDELRIDQDVASAEHFTHVSSLEVLTQTGAGHNLNLNDGGDADTVNEAQEAGIQIINTDWNYVGNDTVNAAGFTSNLTVNIGGYTGDTNGVGGGTDSIVTGSGDDTIKAPGDNNVANDDTIIGGDGSDTLVLDGDTYLDTNSNFSEIEKIVLLEEELDPLNANTYDITLHNGNAPTANGTLTIDGNVLLGDEGVYISSAPVTDFAMSVIGGAGNDAVISGVVGDTISTGAGNDYVNIGLGGDDSVDTGTGDDYIEVDSELTSGDSISGGAGNDTIDASDSTRDIVDADFTNVNSIEEFYVAEGHTSTLAAEAQEAGIRTIRSVDSTSGTVIDASAFTVGVTVYVEGVGAGNNDVVKTGSGNDTIYGGEGIQSYITGDGDDQVIVTGSELTNFDSYAGGAGTDSVILDNTNGAVTAKVNLTNFSDVEQFTILANGDVGNDGLADFDDNSLTFTGGNVGTLTQIKVDASALTDQNDSFTMTLAAGQTDADFQFNVYGSSTETNVVKRNVGTNNNINFHGGTGVDSLFIDGSDLGSTVTMDGGAGLDRIVQTQGFFKTALTDDAFVNISNVEILTGEDAGDLNATLGFEADQAGIVRIDDTAGNDKVTFDAAFNNATTVNLTGGNDTINALASAAVLTINALDSDLTAGDQITGGTTVNDVLNVSAGNGTADLTNVTKVETIKVIDTGLASTTLIIDTKASDLSPGATSQTIDASDLDAPAESLILQGASAEANLNVIGGGGPDQITTGSGNDTVNAGEGNNTIVTGLGNDSVTAGSGDDSIVTGSGNDVVNAGNGNNTVFAGTGNDNVTTGSGNDIVDGGDGTDTISTGAGNDQIYGGLGADVIDTGAGNDQILYRARMESSTSTARDTVTGFTSGSDVIDIRYVTEAIAKYGEGAEIRFVGNLATFGQAQGAITAGDGKLDIVYQQDENALWVDLNDDGVLNGNDIQIVMQGVSTLQAKDVLDTAATGAVVGATLVPSGTSVTGTFLDDRFLLLGVGPWTVDGGLGNDTVVIKNQDISGSSISNVEVAEIDGSATMTYLQHNTFLNLTDGATNPQTITLVGTIYAIQGDASIENYILTGTKNAANVVSGDDFTLGASGQNVQTGVNDDIIRTGAVDIVTGKLDGGAGYDQLVLDHDDDISGANLWDIEETLITESSVKMNAAQHGTDGTNGNAGNIVDRGDAFPDSTDTITITTSTTASVAASATNQKAFNGINGITGLADIENYVLSDLDDKFTLGIGSQNVNTGLGNNEILTGAISNVSGTLGGAGNDTLTVDAGDNLGGINDGFAIYGDGNGDFITGAANTSAVETLKLTGGVVSMTVGQHEGFASIIDTGLTTDVISLSSGGTVNAEVVVDGYIANGNANTKFIVNSGNGSVDLTANDVSGVYEDEVVVNGFAVDGDWSFGGGNDTLTATGTTDISGVNGGAATTLATLNLTGDITATEAQHDDFAAINGNLVNTFTLTDAGANGADSAVLGNASIETYVLNDAFTFTLGAAAQNVTGDADNAQTVIVNGLAVTGTLNGGTGAGDPDTLILNTGTDITNATSITNFENVTVNGSVTMKYGQYNALQPTGGAGTDTINFVGPVVAVTARNAIENYVLANIAGNDFSFANLADQTVSVTTSGSNNDVVRTGDRVDFTGVTLDLAGNTGFVGDKLVVTTDNTDLSGINGGNETTAETLELGAGFTVSMTVDQHEGFTAPFIATGNETVVITDAGLINAEESIENYDLSAAANTIVVNELNGAVNIKDTSGTGDNDRVVINTNVVATGTWDLQNLNDVLEVNGTSTKISGVNGGLATTAEELELTGAINNLTLTQVQHEAFATTTATAGVDTLIIINAGTVTAFADVENYNLSNASNTLIVNAATPDVNVLAIGGSSDTINVGGNKVGGNWNLGAIADTVVAANGADISGVNGGAATTAEFIQIANNASVTMSVAQHEAFASDTLVGFQATGTNTITLSNDGTINGRNQVEAYVLNGDGVGGSTVNINNFLVFTDSNFNVSVTGAGGADKIAINNSAFGMNVGGTWALDGLDDTLYIDGNGGTGDVDITGVNGGDVTTAETLTLADNGDDVIMTSKQHNGFTTVNSPATGANNDGGRNTFTVVNTEVGANTVVGFAGIDAYVLNRTSTGSFDFAIGENGQDVTGTAGDDTIRSTASADNLNGSVIDGGLGNDTLVLDDGDTTVGATLTSLELLSVSGSVTMTGAQYDSFLVGNVKGMGTTDEVTLTTNGNFEATTQAVVADNIEHYILNGATASTITFAGSDATRAVQSVDLAVANGNTIIINDTNGANGGVDASVGIETFWSTAGTPDVLNITVGATHFTGANYTEIASGTDTAFAGAAGAVITITGLADVDLSDLSANGEVETAIGNAIGAITNAGTYLFVLENVDGSGQSGIYAVQVGAGALANLDSTNFDVQSIAIVDHFGTATWSSANFV
ncbi:beta strand repeat-containing protein [Sphingomonas colocasiae]|uniref:Calcium-binding protein n=1 Tax=Sphingomonas colocasiae TaxID=1848973 RepID=A0ABS7PT35_9SPHN|nr:calcium-binding protein [Sphingomonas colocasiae]MBY8824497.1 hypothetical protein [Sphingomonas colocasiae]